MNKILIVEDDPISANYLKRILTDHHLEVCAIADNARDALAAFQHFQPHLVLLDVILDGSKSGCELAVDIRRQNNDTKLIFLSAHSEQSILDYAIDVNAYCFLLKPYRDEEILTTVKMALNDRNTMHRDEKILLQNSFMFDTDRQKLFFEGNEVPLTGKRLELVAFLARHPGISFSYEALCQHLYHGQLRLNALRSLIHRIKQQCPALQLKNIQDEGYVMY